MHLMMLPLASLLAIELTTLATLLETCDRQRYQTPKLALYL
jgi:hypothetical protein